MRIGGVGHAILADARRHVWALRPEVWDSFGRLIALDELPMNLAAEEAPPRRNGKRAERGVAVIPLQGLITPKPNLLSMLFGGGGLSAFRSTLRSAVADEDVSAIVLDVDSPGGSSAMVTETAAEIRAAAEAKPVTAVANVDAGSGAYWLASQAGEVSITPSGMVGSVGAFILHLDMSGLNEKAGVEPTYISAGRFKVEGNPDEPLSDEAEAHLQDLVDETYESFVADVAQGRMVSADEVREGYGEGRMVTAERALETGMVDRIETLESATARMLDLTSAQSAAPSAIVTNAYEADGEDPRGASRSSKSLRESDEAFADEAIAALKR